MPVPPERERQGAERKDGHFQNCVDWSRTLRAWPVACGIGGPVPFLANDKLATRVAASGYGKQIMVAFIPGVAARTFCLHSTSGAPGRCVAEPETPSFSDQMPTYSGTSSTPGAGWILQLTGHPCLLSQLRLGACLIFSWARFYRPDSPFDPKSLGDTAPSRHPLIP